MNAIMQDEERAAKRAELKRRIVERGVQKRQLSSLRKMVAEINSRSDEAANIHRDECLPLQDELEKLNTNQVAAILENEHSDPEDARRLEILREIERHNEMLEATTKSNGSLVDSIQQQLAELGSKVSKTVALESQLARLASEALLEQDILLRSRIEWAGRRLQAANDGLRNCEANLKSARRTRPRAVSGYEILLGEFNREFVDSQQQADEVQAEQNELRKRMLAE